MQNLIPRYKNHIFNVFVSFHVLDRFFLSFFEKLGFLILKICLRSLIQIEAKYFISYMPQQFFDILFSQEGL